jgi:hypothetical protein
VAEGNKAVGDPDCLCRFRARSVGSSVTWGSAAVSCRRLLLSERFAVAIHETALPPLLAEQPHRALHLRPLPMIHSGRANGASCQLFFSLSTANTSVLDQAASCLCHLGVCHKHMV